MSRSAIKILLTVVVVLGAVGSGRLAFAVEGTLKAMAPWKATSFAFPVGEEETYLVGVYSGILYADDGKGPMHTATIVCPGTIEGDLKTMTKTGQGRCIITDEDGDRVYARFSCKGDLEGCRGPFKIQGGTGKFTGITGEGEMISKILARKLTVVTGFEPVQQEGEGIAVWPSVTYRIPDHD